MAFPFLAAQGHGIGAFAVRPRTSSSPRTLLGRPRAAEKLELPVDLVLGDRFPTSAAATRCSTASTCPTG